MNAPLNIEQQFVAAMAEHGLVPFEVVADGRIHRFAGPNEKRGRQSGWYVLYSDGVPSGTFGDWRTGLKENWCAKAMGAMPLTERQAYRERIEKSKAAADAERARLAESARQHCVKLLDKAGPVKQSHAYVETKGITAAGAKQLGTTLLIPLRDTQGALRSLQFIQSTGEKRFKSGGIIAGCYCLIGEAPMPGAPLLVCEGWATGCSLHEATGLPVAAAMSADNLMHVAQSLRVSLPDVPLIICADDDIETKGNPGLSKAREAATAVSARLAVPDFGPNRQTGAADLTICTWRAVRKRSRLLSAPLQALAR
jgi:putative DNA primase/helicase